MSGRITEYRNGDYVFDVIDAGPIELPPHAPRGLISAPPLPPPPSVGAPPSAGAPPRPATPAPTPPPPPGAPPQ